MLADPTPDGCSWCGAEHRGHDEQFFLYAADRHPYTPPTDRQRLARMLARRARRLAPKAPAAVVAQACYIVLEARDPLPAALARALTIFKGA